MPQRSIILTILQHPIKMNLWLITIAMDTMFPNFDYLFINQVYSSLWDNSTKSLTCQPWTHSPCAGEPLPSTSEVQECLEIPGIGYLHITIRWDTKAHTTWVAGKANSCPPLADLACHLPHHMQAATRHSYVAVGRGSARLPGKTHW